MIVLLFALKIYSTESYMFVEIKTHSPKSLYYAHEESPVQDISFPVRDFPVL